MVLEDEHAMAPTVASPEVTNRRRETLAARALRAAAAERRSSELESELGLAREQLLTRDNEILSLEKSLELNAGENLRLSARLSENSAAIDAAHLQLEQMRLAVRAAKAERDEATGKLQAELSALNAQLESALACAATAKKLRSELHEDQLKHMLENSGAARKIGDLETSLKEKERQIQELRSSQSKLVDDLKDSDAALARAEERIRSLAKLFIQLEAKTSDRTGDRAVDETDGPVGYGHMPPVAAKNIHNGSATNAALLKRDLDRDAWLFGGREPLRLS
jgi:DNA repair exonuclease SbcCD ATPase subunit